jgi:nucleotide-binding universal stress UspA family protein
LQELQEQAQPKLTLQKIVVAVDGSENSERAAQVATALAKQYNSELIVLYALTWPVPVISSPNQPYIPEIDYSSGYYQEALKRANRLVDQTVELAKREGVNARGIVDRSISSSTVEAIVNQSANVHADLIVIGTRGLGGFKRLIMGSVSSGVVTHANCSVLVVR